MWKTKTWKLSEMDAYKRWIAKNSSKFQVVEIFVNNALAVEYRPLKKGV